MAIPVADLPSGMQLKVLVVEDDAELAAAVAADVGALGWTSRRVDTVAEARRVLGSETIDLIYLDRMLADGTDGLDLLEWFRDIEAPAPGTLVASRLSSTDDHITGLDLGADDYIDKPFDSGELRARLRALARRVSAVRAPRSVLVWGQLELRTLSRVALWAGTPLAMKPQTFDLLHVLAVHRGEWVSRQALWRATWPNQARVAPRDYVINVAISRLRETLEVRVEGPRVETRDRLGYRLALPQT